ncbi:MAG TPA: ATP-binding protein [Verrucomicrobiae bacterium]|nr:ATP-binding protein [Verrucomicrobiae bacterium]
MTARLRINHLPMLKFLAMLGMAAISGRAASGPEFPVIQSVVVDNTPLSWNPEKELNLGAFPRNILFNIGLPTNSNEKMLRLRTKLEGFDKDWQDGGGEMFVTIRFYNAGGDVVAQKTFSVHGESAVWNGTLKGSTFTHRRETFSAPLDASRLWVIISSAGGPTTVGIYVVDNMIVSRLSGSNSPPEVLLRTPFPQESSMITSLNQAPPGWDRDGTRPSMARIVEVGQTPATKALAVVDDDPESHAEWHNSRATAAPVRPNDNLLIEWNEMYSIGISGNRAVFYESLPPGSYKFRVEEVSVLGKPTGQEATLAIRVPLPYWQTTWFWAVLAGLTMATSVLSVRYFTWHKMRRAMIHLEQQRLLERERLRIAQDIHDDLGARVTEISLLSGMAENNGGFSDQARTEFFRISVKSRDLVAALYETVWAVNPQNDNLEAIGNYLRQRINNQCTQAQLRCRLHISQLPRDVEISSRVRHNISMAAREAMHNVIKHAKASQVTVHISFADMLLSVSIQDDGCSFDSAATPTGNGLVNMKRRLEDIGGSCEIESLPGTGTAVRFRFQVRPSNQAPGPGQSESAAATHNGVHSRKDNQP